MASTRTLACGEWNPDTVTVTPKFKVGQLVVVQPRTWAGINRPGGHGQITEVHYNDEGEANALDVKYTIGRSFDCNLGLHLVEPWEEPERAGRSSRRNIKVEEKPTPLASGKNKENAPKNKKEPQNENQAEPEKEVAKGKKEAKPLRQKLTGRRKKIAENLRKLGRTRRTTFVPPPKTPETHQTQSSDQHEKFLVPIEVDCCDDNQSVISDLGDEENRGIEDSSMSLSMPEDRQPLGQRLSLIVGNIGLADSITVGSGARSRDSRPPVSVTRSLMSGRYNLSKPKTILSGEFKLERSANKRKSPPSPPRDSMKPPLPQGRAKKNKEPLPAKPPGPKSRTIRDLFRLSQVSPQKTNVPTKSVAHKTLEQVFEGEKASAKQFIEQVVSDKMACENNESTEAAICIHHSPVADRSSDLELQKQFFVALLNELLQSDDDMVEESAVLVGINQLAHKRDYLNKSAQLPIFNQEIVDLFVAELCNENKIMRSDGQIFLV